MAEKNHKVDFLKYCEQRGFTPNSFQLELAEQAIKGREKLEGGRLPSRQWVKFRQLFNAYIAEKSIEL